MKNGKKILLYPALTLIALYFLFTGLVKAESFLVPLVTAMVLAFLMFPITNKLEKWGINKILATLTSILILIMVTAAYVAIILSQVKGFADDWEEIQIRLEETIDEISEYLVENTPLEKEHLKGFTLDKEEDDLEQGTGDKPGSQRRQALTMMGAVVGYLTQLLIIVVYIFLIIHFRYRFKEFILRFFPYDKQDEVAGIISSSSSVSRRYLAGKLLLMVFLTILYFTGLIISGLENALLISLIAAALSIIPVVGNFIGYCLAVAVSLVTAGGMGAIIGITLTFAIAQIIDTYILQPIVLGDKLDVHPFFIILSVILGYEVWGIMGMVLSIPIFAMITVVCRHVPVLNPFGYLFSKGSVEDPGDETG